MNKIQIIPSDIRQEYIKEYLEKKGHFCEISSDILKLKASDAVILPIPSMCADKIRTLELSPDEFSKKLNKNSVVFAFCLKDNALQNALKEKNIPIYDLYGGELAVKNAYATAQGVLGYILSDTDKMMRETKILLSGYGKTGRAICEILSQNKVKLTVLARREEYRSELVEKDIESYSYSDAVKIENGFDYIINTVDCLVIKESILKKLKPSGKVIEIASKPYGIDFDEAKKMSIKCEILSSLPSKAVPESAGTNIAQAVERKIEEMIEEGKLWGK